MENLWNDLRRYPQVLVLGGLFLFFSVLSPYFATTLNLKNILLNNTYMLVIVSGLSMIMICGGIDFSMGYQIALIAVTTGAALDHGLGLVISILAGVLAGVLCGMLNGVLVTVFSIPSHIATFFTQFFFQSLSNLITGDGVQTAVSDDFRFFTKLDVMGFPLDVWLMLICVFLVSFVFHFTFFGRQIKAIGMDMVIAKNAGISVEKNCLMSYMFASLFYALAAFILVSKQGIASAATGPGNEVIAITAAVMGSNSVFRVVVCTLICAVLENGLQMIGASQYLLYACIFVLVVVNLLYRNRRRRKNRYTIL